MDRRHFLGISTVGLGMVFAGCSDTQPDTNGGAEDSTPTSTERQTPTQDSTPVAQTAEAIVGEVVKGDRLSMVLREVRKTESLNRFQTAESGNEFVVVRIVVKNTTKSEFANFSGFLQTRVRDNEGYEYSQTLTGSGKAFQGGQLAPGEVTRGDIAYEIPKDASGLTLTFDFQTFAFFQFDRVTVNLSKTADSVGDLKQNLKVPVHDVGKSVSSSQTAVTVNSVDFRKEVGGQYGAEADSGNTFAIIDISVENNSDEEKNVSSILQMGMKDGTGLSYAQSVTATSQLDRSFSEGTPISAGSKRRGKIAYEVPSGAGKLFWTFEFAVFVSGNKTFWQVR